MPEQRPGPPGLYRPAVASQPLALPLAGHRVVAGFPSPADDHLEDRLDLNAYLIRHPAATFLMRVAGESMLGEGIHPGDLLVVDRALSARSGRVVVVALDGELTVKRLREDTEGIWLDPANPDYPSLAITEAMDCEVWGVVTHVIHAL
ncbi:MAG: translesion error-prone DNA polymerase V autoproteolytic subunit [Candidatus Competibacterales bacterium]|nr:translesion error-prone DNA polymerase V autoproteolytic subunit [Candidatus Competibacterales bacterium]